LTVRPASTPRGTGGEDASYPEKFALIYAALRERGVATSPARFVCALAVVKGDRVLFETRGIVEGTIAPQQRGSAGLATTRSFSIRRTARRSLKPKTQRRRSATAERRFARCKRFLASRREGTGGLGD